MRLQHVSKIQKKPSDFIVSDIKTVLWLDCGHNVTYLRFGTDEEGRVVLRMGNANASDDVLDVYIDHDTIPFILNWLSEKWESKNG